MFVYRKLLPEARKYDFICIFDFIDTIGHDSYLLQHHSVHPESKEPLPAQVLSVQYGMCINQSRHVMVLSFLVFFCLYSKLGGQAERADAEYHCHGANSLGESLSP